jgi:hypothetical protein
MSRAPSRRRTVQLALRAEFKRIGETQLRDVLNGGIRFTDEPKRQAAFRWLGDEAEVQRLREEQTLTMSGGPSSPLSPL